MIVQNPRGISLTFVEKTQQTKTQLDQLAVASPRSQSPSAVRKWTAMENRSCWQLYFYTFGNHNF